MALKAEEVYAILNGKIQTVSDSVSSLGTAIVYKGDVESEDNLPENPSVGDMYNITSDSSYGAEGMNVAWTGTNWDPMGPTIDLGALKAPSPYKLKFTGASTQEYDGSAEVIVNIPEGGTSGTSGKLKADGHTVKYVEV